MAAIIPFQPNIQTGQPGFTVAVVVATVSGAGNAGSVVPASGSSGVGFGEAASLMVTNVGANTSWIRMSVESSTVAGSNVTFTDTPMLGNSVRLFADPNPIGATGIAVIGTVGGNTVLFTPGQGGI